MNVLLDVISVPETSSSAISEVGGFTLAGTTVTIVVLALAAILLAASAIIGRKKK